MILCITHSADYYTVDLVQEHLRQLGMDSFRFNTDELALSFSCCFTPDGYELKIAGRTIRPREVQAVWLRKTWALQLPPELDPAYHTAVVREFTTARDLFFQSLQHLPWINALAAVHAVAGNKLEQLRQAAAVGITVPPTLFTSDAAAATAFFHRHGGDIVVKLHNALSKSMRGDTAFFPTTRLQKGDESSFGLLSSCPMLLQPCIRKQYELRIVYVDGVFFAGRICVGEEVTDWRTLPASAAAWQPYNLPGPLCEKLTTLMLRLGLSFGAIDMIRQKPGGDYVFLEVNPQGEWGMLQKELGYPIAQTIAEKLVNLTRNEK